MIKRDKKTAASLTQFPFQYGFDAGDEGTLSEVQFTKRFDEIFGAYKKLFERNNPIFHSEAGGYDLTSDDATHFRFERKGASYKFTAIIAEP